MLKKSPTCVSELELDLPFEAGICNMCYNLIGSTRC